MPSVYVSSVIGAPVAKVWERVRDFNGLPAWHSGILESRIENGEPSDKIGCVREARLEDGRLLRERLLGLSDSDMAFTYAILESPVPLTNYVSTLRLIPITDGDQTFARWSADFDCAPEAGPAPVKVIGEGVFQAGFDALKRHFKMS
jgi:hypothetical protein